MLVNLVFVLLLGLAILSSKKIGLAIRELARGGPRPPSHPLPGDDSRFLNRARSSPSPER
jgi:hypothetical protein